MMIPKNTCLTRWKWRGRNRALLWVVVQFACSASSTVPPRQIDFLLLLQNSGTFQGAEALPHSRKPFVLSKLLFWGLRFKYPVCWPDACLTSSLPWSEVMFVLTRPRGACNSGGPASTWGICTRRAGKLLQSSFSAVSKPNFASK